ncbi:DNA polymerase III subunit delta [Paraglaciecola hydrolytica]|uniref:DNA polymerase III subunit delta n=1 Tax=Paraglaciecola hydrolytica TaxID=1799789 RepID=A0A136A5R9_9ALTE|nr:DNA polymerase III subunit delta [Paraglaciecola hydrolytica]KXI30592.1 DNA polymerase III subunit delta [Paraglaciecola hydrolytica]
MQVYPNRLKAAVEQKLAAFYLIFGDEPQQKLEAIQTIRDVALKQGFDERQSLTADTQFNWDTLVEATQTMSLFSARQLIELELPTGKPGTEGSKILNMLASQANPDVLIVLHGAKIGKDVQSSKWFKALDKLGVYVPCYPLEGNQLEQWLSQQMQLAGLQASKQICQLLVDYCEGNMLAAKQEIQKLALLYPAGNPSLEQVEQAVVDQSRFTVFHLIDVLLAGDAQKAVKMLYRLESEGIEPTIILWALSREWQTLQALLFARQAGQTPNWNQHRIWGSRQALYNAAMQRLSLANMHTLQQKLSVLDFAIKQSQINRPYVELCHLCLMFIPFQLDAMPLDYGLSD